MKVKNRVLIIIFYLLYLVYVAKCQTQIAIAACDLIQNPSSESECYNLSTTYYTCAYVKLSTGATYCRSSYYKIYGTQSDNGNILIGDLGSSPNTKCMTNTPTTYVDCIKYENNCCAVEINNKLIGCANLNSSDRSGFVTEEYGL